MKKHYLVFAALIGLSMIFPSRARADMPVLTKIQYTTNIKCNKISGAPDAAKLVKIECSPEDLKTYPFLADLTKDRTVQGTSYRFGIARVEDKALDKPILLVNMQNEMIYTLWGSTGSYAVNKDGSYTPQWTVGGGTVAYTASCPKQLSFMILGNEEKNFAKWVYDGKSITRVGGYDKLDSMPACD
jgi:hypothetical protein